MTDTTWANTLEYMFELLQAYRGDGAFNQYLESNPDLEKPDGPAIRRRNLRRYLCEFANASYLLVGEAAGYAGCRFSGIPFTRRTCSTSVSFTIRSVPLRGMDF